METPPDLVFSGPNVSSPLLPWRPWVGSGVHLIPAEILSEIFLLVVEKWEGYRNNLMLVCWRWHDIILSTPGIHTQLWIRRATKKEVVQACINGRKTRFVETKSSVSLSTITDSVLEVPKSSVLHRKKEY